MFAVLVAVGVFALSLGVSVFVGKLIAAGSGQ
jgi:hypothetical protein